MQKKGVTAAVFEVEQWEQKYLEQKLSQCSFTFSKKIITPTSAKQVSDAEILCVFVASKITKPVLDQLPNLKFIATMSTGFDHIDLEECARRGIKVSNVPTYGENTVAEHAFALLLNISRRIFDSVELTRKGRFDYEGLRGFDLKEKTIGVIGTGRIGLNVVRIAKGFGMKVVAYDLYPNKDAAKELGFVYLKSVNEVVSQSDVITLHTPYMKETHHLISLKNLNHVKKGCVLINTARGKLVETAALIKGLRNETFKAVGLDVLEEESFIKEEKQLLSKEFQNEFDLKTVLEQHVLIEHPNVYVTPHNAFNSAEALTRIMNTTIENVQGYLAKKLVNLVVVKK